MKRHGHAVCAGVTAEYASVGAMVSMKRHGHAVCAGYEGDYFVAFDGSQ